jgi:U3 small nucleolar RNA-associated protein 22
MSEFEHFVKRLKKLPLSLPVSEVLGCSPAFRSMEIIPPKTDFSDSSSTKLLFLLHVVLQLEPSSKWPDDLSAIYNLKAAFYVQISESLSSSRFKQRFRSHATPTYLDVCLPSGLVLRCSILYKKEIGLYKRFDENTAKQLELDLIHRPLLNKYLHSASVKHPAYGPTIGQEVAA